MQSEIPDLTGITRGTWSNYENGKTEPDIETIINISKFFRIDIKTLLLVDLSENVHLITNEEEKKEYKNVHPIVHPSVHLLKEDQVKYETKQQTDLLILKQLNSLSDQIKKIDEKIDRRGN